MNSQDDLLKITSLAWSFVPFNSIKFSIEKNLFALISEENISVTDIAEKKGWKIRPTEALISLLRGLDLVTVENEKVKLTGLSKKFLLPISDFYIGDFYIRNALLEKAYTDLGNLMVNDLPNKDMNEHVKASFGLTNFDSSAIKEFGKPMVSASKIILSDFIKKYPLNPNATILDIGAGLGALEEVLSDHKGAITVLETPEVANIAEIKFSQFSSILFKKESWSTWKPKGQYDLVFLNHVLHEEKLTGAKDLFEKATTSLKDEGKLIVISFMREEGEGFETAAIFRMNLLLEMGSDLPSLAWVRAEAKESGIKEEAVLELPGGRVAWIGTRS